jgi:hypothetical protein
VKRAALALALALPACAAGEDPLAGQLACQQRLVELPLKPGVTPQTRHGQTVAAAYEGLSRRYAAMRRDGCTDEQRAQVGTMARLTHEIGAVAARLPKPESADANSLASSRGYLEFTNLLQQFEKRRIAMQQDLERMRAARLR